MLKGYFSFLCYFFPAKLVGVPVAVIGYQYRDCVFTSWSKVNF